MSGIITLASFIVGFTIFMFGSRKLNTKVALGLVIVAAVGLYMIVPHPFLFGMILATGWCLLNLGVDWIFPLEN